MATVVIERIEANVEAAVDRVLQRLGGPKALLKSSGEVYIKINAVDSQPHTYTSPELVGAVVSRFRAAGASRVEVIENSTHGNYTRSVFGATGLRRAVRGAGGRVRYLDEETAERIRLPGGPFARQEPRFPATVIDLMHRRNEVTYINLPKLKTHSMSDVTLGLKNQWGLLIHDDRVADHNFLIHAKIAAIAELISPDLTLIDGNEAVVHGHFPAEALSNRCVVPMGILIASQEMVAADMVGSSILGFNPEEVEHVRLAADARRVATGGRIKLGDIEVVGQMPRPLGGESKLLDEFPPQVSVFEGTERCCREGCKGNSLGALQNIGLDFEGKGRFNLVFGQGHDAEKLLESADNTMLCGDCAIAELGPRLMGRTRGKIVVASGCNNLPEIIGGTCALLGVPFSRLVRRNGLRGVCSTARAVLAGTDSNLARMRPEMLSEERIEEARRSVEQLNTLWESYASQNRSKTE